VQVWRQYVSEILEFFAEIESRDGETAPVISRLGGKDKLIPPTS
jgi:hypothetical protein